jgi:hypothetical protein
MERETALAQKLRRVDYDLDRLTEAQRIEIFDLARSAQVELWRPGARWSSGTGADLTGGGLSRLDVTRP